MPAQRCVAMLKPCGRQTTFSKNPPLHQNFSRFWYRKLYPAKKQMLYSKLIPTYQAGSVGISGMET